MPFLAGAVPVHVHVAVRVIIIVVLIVITILIMRLILLLTRIARVHLRCGGLGGGLYHLSGILTPTA